MVLHVLKNCLAPFLQNLTETLAYMNLDLQKLKKDLENIFSYSYKVN